LGWYYSDKVLTKKLICKDLSVEKDSNGPAVVAAGHFFLLHPAEQDPEGTSVKY
jgi:hypothetical protein